MHSHLPKLATISAIIVTTIFASSILSPIPTTFSAEGRSCIDSDGGQVGEKAGFAAVRMNSEYVEKKADVCSGESLMEYYCDSETLVETVIDCKYGCGAGACLPENALYSPSTSDRRISRNKRLAARSDRRRYPSRFRKQIQTYGFPTSGVRRNLFQIGFPGQTVGPHAASEEEEIEKPSLPARCARLSEARRKRVRACNLTN